MHIEILAGTANVVRFPVERRARATMQRLHELAPDIREIAAIADAFGFESVPHDYRDQVDAQTARHLAEQAPRPHLVPQALLRDMERAAVEAALRAIVTAGDAAVAARQADALLARAKSEGGYVLEPLRERAACLGHEAAALLVEAHARCEEAEGVARAVDLARRGETWRPRDVRAEMDELIAVHLAAAR